MVEAQREGHGMSSADWQRLQKEFKPGLEENGSRQTGKWARRQAGLTFGARVWMVGIKVRLQPQKKKKNTIS